MSVLHYGPHHSITILGTQAIHKLYDIIMYFMNSLGTVDEYNQPSQCLKLIEITIKVHVWEISCKQYTFMTRWHT